MKSILIAILSVLLAKEAQGQSAQSILPYQSPQIDAPQQATPNLHLEDWRKAMASPASPTSGVTIYFDYTKLFEWLLPKKHPKIPQECDPKFFLHDSISAPPTIKEDSVRVTKPPV
jgi:hypothetical protein